MTTDAMMTAATGLAAPKLTVELVPSTCWYSNVRTNVSIQEWATCKQFVRDRSGNRCEVCGGRGSRWPVECHEVWDYEVIDGTMHGPQGQTLSHTSFTQRLTGLIALCPSCHEVKHIGRAEAIGHLGRATAHLATVNGWSTEETELYLQVAFELWAARSQHQWTLDISYLTDVLGP